MGKRQISQKDYDFFQKEISHHQLKERISNEQLTEMLKVYDIKKGINFINVLVTLGAVLIGLGILSFVASNWIYIWKPIKVILIIGSFLIVNFLSYRTKDKYPFTSRAFMYLGILIYGAGIFLMGQIFHFGGRFTDAFLLWAVGIFPLVILIRDKWAFLLLHILLLIYLNGHYVYESLPYILIIAIPVLYLTQATVIKSRLVLYFTNLLTLNFIWFLLNMTIGLDSEFVLFIFFLIGLILFFIPIPYETLVFKLTGNIVFGIAGLFLTLKSVWYHIHWISSANIPMHIIFSILFIFFLLYLIKEKNLNAIIFLSATILRFYFDTLYGFLPKSIFFFIGGIILLGFGYYFEQKRRRIRGEISEK